MTPREPDQRSFMEHSSTALPHVDHPLSSSRPRRGEGGARDAGGARRARALVDHRRKFLQRWSTTRGGRPGLQKVSSAPAARLPHLARRPRRAEGARRPAIAALFCLLPHLRGAGPSIATSLHQSSRHCEMQSRTGWRPLVSVAPPPGAASHLFFFICRPALILRGSPAFWLPPRPHSRSVLVHCASLCDYCTLIWISVKCRMGMGRRERGR